MVEKSTQLTLEFQKYFGRGTVVNIGRRGLWHITSEKPFFEFIDEPYVRVACGTTNTLSVPISKINPRKLRNQSEKGIELTKEQAETLGMQTTDTMIIIPQFGITFWRGLDRIELKTPQYLSAQKLFPDQKILARDLVIEGANHFSKIRDS